MTSLEEAKELRKRVLAAQNAINYSDSFKRDIKESEVKFRYESLNGVLLMILNDVTMLVQDWKE